MSTTSKPWTQEEARRALELREQGLTFARIGRQLGRSAGTVQMRLVRDGHELPKPNTARRPCLCCGKNFNSTGPGNRLCAAGRRKDDGGNMWRYAV